MNYVSCPIILLIMKYGDNLNASIAEQQLILMRNIDEAFWFVLHIHLSENCGSLNFALSLIFFLPV